MIAERIALMEGAKALVTGESLGQVASQTLENIQCTNAAVSLPVLRPLIGSDKVEIISEAERIGTFEIIVLKTRLIAARSICRAILKRTLSSPWCSRLKKSCGLVSGSKRRLQGLRYTIIAALRIAGLSKPKKHK